jgi:hypothetical protein
MPIPMSPLAHFQKLSAKRSAVVAHVPVTPSSHPQPRGMPASSVAAVVAGTSARSTTCPSSCAQHGLLVGHGHAWREPEPRPPRRVVELPRPRPARAVGRQPVELPRRRGGRGVPGAADMHRDEQRDHDDGHQHPHRRSFAHTSASSRAARP